MGATNYRPFDAEAYPIDDLDQVVISIVRTEWNEEVVSKMEESCKSQLVSIGISLENISSYLVPGSYELPLGAKYVLASTLKPDAVICLGCIVQGETKHDDYISHAVARSISQISLLSNVPVIFGVLTTNNLDQAHARAGGKKGDKGEESAITALKMLSLKQQLKSQGKKISF